jgi:hypothetical protein
MNRHAAGTYLRGAPPPLAQFDDYEEGEYEPRGQPAYTRERIIYVRRGDSPPPRRLGAYRQELPPPTQRQHLQNSTYHHHRGPTPHRRADHQDPHDPERQVGGGLCPSEGRGLLRSL